MRSSLHKVVEELVDDLESGEHVDGYWLRDTCEIHGWKLVLIGTPKNTNEEIKDYEAFEIMHNADGTFNKSVSSSRL